MNHRYQLLFNDTKDNFPISLGIKIGTFYDIDYEHYSSDSLFQKISLFTLCYRPKHQDFVKIDHIDLPKRLQQRYKDAYNNEQTLTELEEIGIHSYQSVSSFIENFHNYQEFLAYCEYKNTTSNQNNEIYEKMLEMQNLLESKPLIKKSSNKPLAH